MTTNKTLTPKEFENLIKLANLTLSDKEKESIHSQLSEALDAVNVLNQAPTKNIKAIEHPTGLRNVTREDKVGPSLTQEEALSNAKRTHKGFFLVDAILDHK